MSNAANFTLDGYESPYITTHGSEVRLELVSKTGIRTVQWEVFSYWSNEEITVPSITKSGTPFGSIGTLTLPSVSDDFGAAYGIRCTVRDANGTESICRAGIYVLNQYNVAPGFPGETYEYDSVNGWAGRFNGFLGEAYDPSSITADERSIVGRAVSGDGECSSISLGTNGILARPSTGDITDLQLGWDQVVGRLEGGDLDAIDINDLSFKNDGTAASAGFRFVDTMNIADTAFDGVSIACGHGLGNYLITVQIRAVQEDETVHKQGYLLDVDQNSIVSYPGFALEGDDLTDPVLTGREGTDTHSADLSVLFSNSFGDLNVAVTNNTGEEINCTVAASYTFIPYPEVP